MENRIKRPVTYMLIFSVFLAIAFHLDKLPHFFSYFIGITFPLLIGAVMAFILNVPMRGFERLLEKIDKKNVVNYMEVNNMAINLGNIGNIENAERRDPIAAIVQGK